MSSMTKKYFVALADAIREHNQLARDLGEDQFTEPLLLSLAKYCEEQNHAFNRVRWLNYIANGAGSNGQPNQWP